jgi:hypothetical protein
VFSAREMETLELKSSIESLQASRAFGAMIFAFFGSAWMVLWSFRGLQNRVVALAVIGAGTVVIFLYALYRYRQHQGALAAEAESPAKKRAARLFNILNAAQWILILIVGNVLANVGVSDWVISAAIFIVGLHFLPLARIFSNPAHYVTGGALTLVAIACQLLPAGVPMNPIGCLGAGLVLWASALWAATPTPSLDR